VQLYATCFAISTAHTKENAFRVKKFLNAEIKEFTQNRKKISKFLFTFFSFFFYCKNYFFQCSSAQARLRAKFKHIIQRSVKKETNRIPSVTASEVGNTPYELSLDFLF